MAKTIPDDFDIEALFARLRPPETPEAVLQNVEGLRERLARWDRIQALSILAGLQMLPEFQPNATRLEIASRLVMVSANGSHKPTRADLWRLLNRDLVKSQVSMLEDPAEDFFVTPIVTNAGEFRIFEGLWEKAASFTEDIFEAFWRLPDHETKTHSIACATAILKLSSIMVERIGLVRHTLGGGQPKGEMRLPAEHRLTRIARYALLSWDELAQLNIPTALLAPFILSPERFEGLKAAAIGESDLEFCPLLETAEGYLVVAPNNISTCVRAILIDTAVQGSADIALRRRLLDVQAERVSLSGLMRLWSLPVQNTANDFMRQAIRQVSPGRYIHVVQTVDSFAEWPKLGFSSGISDTGETMKAVVESAKTAKIWVENQPNFREGISLVFLGSWGRASAFALPDVPELKDWDFIFLTPDDAATIGLTENGKIADLWRLKKQEDVVTKQGFELFGANGYLNLYGLWCETGHTLIPEHYIDIQPPCVFNFPTDLLFKVRIRAALKGERRAVRHPDGHYRIVSRLDRADLFRRNEPIFASMSDARNGNLLGVSLHSHRPVWLNLRAGPDDAKSWDNHETWRAALHWLAVGLPLFFARFSPPGTAPVLIELEVQWPESGSPTTVSDEEIDRSISLHIDSNENKALLTLSPDWQRGLHRANNYAEVALAAKLLFATACLTNSECKEADLREMILQAVGSEHIRWRHSFVADRPLMIMSALGLLPKFEAISPSAAALAKCGSSFQVRPRSAGAKIEGGEKCFEFLMSFHDFQLTRLRAAVALYNRAELVTAALARLQSAQNEERVWSLSARALRAIHGVDDDLATSFEQRNAINATLRGCSLVAEVAACESQIEGGFSVGDMDLDELQALAMLHFQGAEIIPPIRGGFLKPKLEISPTGDVLYDHSFGEQTLHNSAEISHADDREASSEAYLSHFVRENKATEHSVHLLQAIESEFCVPAQMMFNLSAAMCEIATASNTCTPIIRRSELVLKLAEFPDLAGTDYSACLRRLTLESRDGWMAIPQGRSARDYDLSRFDRPHSLIGRPLIALTGEDDPLLVIAPGLIERSALHNLSGAMSGALHGDFWSSKEMRRYVGGAAERLGLEFNDEVAAHIASMGLWAKSSVKPSDCLNQKATDDIKRLGDIDILAISADHRHAWVIEAKDIRFCRTLAETANRLSEYRGIVKRDGKPDNLLRHLQRVDYVRTHAEHLARRLKLSRTPKVHGLVVVDSPQPMAFMPVHGSADAKTFMLRDLSTVPWKKGWTVPITQPERKAKKRRHNRR